MDNGQYVDEIFGEEPQRLLENSNNNELPFENKPLSPISDDGIVKISEQQNNHLLVNKEISTNEKIPIKFKKRKLKFNNFKPYEKHCIVEDEVVNFPNSEETDEPVKDKRQGIIGNIREDSSWYDLTDTSHTSIILNPLGSGDAVRSLNVPACKQTLQTPQSKAYSSKVQQGTLNTNSFII